MCCIACRSAHSQDDICPRLQVTCGNDVVHFCNRWTAIRSDSIIWGGFFLLLSQTLVLIFCVTSLTMHRALSQTRNVVKSAAEAEKSRRSARESKGLTGGQSAPGSVVSFKDIPDASTS